MFENFPKTRPVLPPEIEKIYTEHYKLNRAGGTPASSLAQKMESWLHKKVAMDTKACNRPKTTLEIGAGNLNQLPYEKEIGPYDIVEPFKDLYEDSPNLFRIRTIYKDISEVPRDEKYDRITSIAAFEHVCNLPDVIARCGLLLKPNGSLRVSIPSEGTLLWRLGWKFTTGLEFRLKHGLDYGILIRHEHVNTAKEIEMLLRHFFLDVKVSSLGLCKSLSLYQFYVCTKADLQECRKFAP